MNGDREQILSRINEALRVPARRPHSHGAPAKTPPPLPAAFGVRATASFREWLPKVGESLADRRALFGKLSEALKTEICDCTNVAAAAGRLSTIASEKGWRKLALHHGELTDAVAAALPPSLELFYADGSLDKNALEACDAGLTECECLVAQTGSVCMTSRSSGGRALSVLPPHHLVIARTSQLEPDLTAAYELLARKYINDYPSFITFATGPSRTGDIERILVLGAHGPKWVTILLIP
jgi:L-lactate dehydrogenase complex protein LldG